jgi:membrane carboxypeptidase/penicillin-binding protein
VGVLDKARVRSRVAIEMLYEHTCSIIEHKNVKNPVTKVTKLQEVIVLENQPCKLSFSNIRPSEQTESANSINQVVKLFIAPEIVIKEGSKIIINHNGRVSEYKNSGVPAIYSSHQEIVLELFKGWS